MKHYQINKGTIVTLETEEMVQEGKFKIRIIPATEWLLSHIS